MSMGGTVLPPPPDNPVAALQEKLEGLNAAHDLVMKNSSQMLKFASECESGESSVAKPKEMVALFKVTAAAMVQVCEREGMARPVGDIH